MRAGLILMAALVLATGPARALELTLPGSAELSAEVQRNPDSYGMPVAPFKDGVLPVVDLEGDVLQQAWRIENSGMTTLQMIRPLRDQLAGAGYEIILECGGQECGGFDFRFGTSVMAAPDMYIDLFDFRFLSARDGAAGEGGPENYVSVFASRSGGVGYVQIIRVSQNGILKKTPVAPEENTPPAAEPESDPPVIEALTERGHVILRDLDFATGSARLGEGPHASLAALAEFLLADSARRIALVGHTDKVGSLTNNVALSRERALAVFERLVAAYKVPRGQLEAEGVGYLSPIAPNQKTEGREANRRVEAVLLDME